MKKIIVIEDNKSLNFIITAIFKRSNFLVDSVYQGKSALALLEKNSYDALITDMNLPDISGLEILERIKELPIIKVLVAAYCDEDNLRELKMYGATFIEKPFRNSFLLETVLKKLDLL
ncbi:MAG: response regulator [Candidatus Cloacimonadales bacterium]